MAEITTVRPIRYDPRTDQIQMLEEIAADDMQDMLDSLACDQIDAEPVMGWAPYTHRIEAHGGYIHAHSDYLAEIS